MMDRFPGVFELHLGYFSNSIGASVTRKRSPCSLAPKFIYTKLPIILVDVWGAESKDAMESLLD